MILRKLLKLPSEYPLIRGMITYAIIWPASSLCQEYIEKGTTLKDADWGRALRFGIFGTFFMAPVFYTWTKYSGRYFKGKNLKTALSRAWIEQVTYTPLAISYIFFAMSLLEGKPYERCVEEVKEKFWPTYKKGLVFWPCVQTINFWFVAEKNMILFVGLASFVWTVYLAHVMSGHKNNDADNMYR